MSLVMNSSISSNSTINTLSGFGYAMIPVAILGTISSCFSTLHTLRMLFSRKKFLAKTYNLMFFNTSIASLLFSAFYLPVAAFSTIVGPKSIMATKDYRSFCVVTAFCYFFLTTTCAFTHSAIAVNRLFVVVFPQSQFLQSRNCALLLITTSWTAPAITFIFPFFNVFGAYGFAPSSRCAFLNVNSTYQTVYKTVTGFAPLGIMLFCYGIVVFCEIASKKRLSPVDANRRTLKESKLRREVRATRTAILTCAAFSVCYLPNSIVGVAASLKFVQSSSGQIASLWMWIGCSLTPAIYILLSSELRHRIWGICGSMQHGRNSSNEGASVPRTSLRRSTIPQLTPETHTSHRRKSRVEVNFSP